jgi:hypothetical protein
MNSQINIQFLEIHLNIILPYFFLKRFVTFPSFITKTIIGLYLSSSITCHAPTFLDFKLVI